MQLGIKLTKNQNKLMVKAINKLKNKIGTKRRMTAIIETYNDLLNHYYINMRMIDELKKERIGEVVYYYTLYTNPEEKSKYDKIKLISTTDLLFTILHKFKD